MDNYRSEPGASTPYPAINQLLDRDERYLIKWPDYQTYLFIPKSIHKIPTLLFLLHEQGVNYSLSRHLMPLDNVVFLSLQNINKVMLLENDAVEVQTGCELEELHRWLFERGRELAWSNIPAYRLNIREAMQKNLPEGVILKETVMEDRLLALELINSDGEILRFGNPLNNSTLGPTLHELFWGMEIKGAVSVKAVFKTERIPAVRLCLSWDFEQPELLWDYFHRLKGWTSTWERLDCLVARPVEEKSFIIAQISGIKAEMDAFKCNCPFYANSKEEDRFNIFKKYFIQTRAVFEPMWKIDINDFKSADYLWYHGLTNSGWLIYKQNYTPFQEKLIQKPLWTERLFASLENEKR